MLKIRRPLGRLIFNMGIAIPGKTVFLIETAPWLLGFFPTFLLCWVYFNRRFMYDDDHQTHCTMYADEWHIWFLAIFTDIQRMLTISISYKMNNVWDTVFFCIYPHDVHFPHMTETYLALTNHDSATATGRHWLISSGVLWSIYSVAYLALSRHSIWSLS